MSSQFDARRSRIIANLLALYRSATAVDRRSGRAWYPNAHRLVCELAETYQQSTQTVACVVAAISPQCEWSRNLVIASDVLAGRSPSIGGALHANIAKAHRIAADRATVDDMGRYFPHGPKVTTFALNLSGDYRLPTVDTHAFQAAINDPLSTTSVSWPVYRSIADCYMAAAARVNVEPAAFQAVVWHVWKRRYPRVWKLQQRRQWFPVATE